MERPRSDETLSTSARPRALRLFPNILDPTDVSAEIVTARHEREHEHVTADQITVLTSGDWQRMVEGQIRPGATRPPVPVRGEISEEEATLSNEKMRRLGLRPMYRTDRFTSSHSSFSPRNRSNAHE